MTVGNGVTATAFAVWQPDSGFIPVPFQLDGPPPIKVHALERVFQQTKTYIYVGGEFVFAGQAFGGPPGGAPMAGPGPGGMATTGEARGDFAGTGGELLGQLFVVEKGCLVGQVDH